LTAVTVDCDGLLLEGLHDEIRYHAAIVRMHARPVGVENARDLDGELVLPAIGEKQRPGAAFALAVAGALPVRIDVAQ